MNRTLERNTIMIVDDEIVNLKLLERMLSEDAGFRVVAFPSGKMALKAAALNPPDLILLDINMPEMNGFEMCELLKANESLQDIPVLFISALTETSDKLKAFRMGGVDYITKPFQFEELRARVKTHLEIVRQKRELQRSYDKLCELEDMRDGLVHMIVHDMRSPLTAILGSLELIQMDPSAVNTARRVDDALRVSERLVNMISSILDIGKMEAGGITPNVSPVDIKSRVYDAIRNVDPIKGQRSIVLESSNEVGTIACDVLLIDRVLDNLLNNALKCTDKDEGMISVRMEHTAHGGVRVAIGDNGWGIPPESCEKIFDKFYQVKARREGQSYSTGLGLTFCKLAVEAHDGRIGVESQVGRGTTFWFELPRRSATSSVNQGNTKSAHRSPSLSNGA